MLSCTMTASAQLRLAPDNVDEILKAMTLEEKATLVVGTSRQGSTGGSQGGNGMVGAHADAVPGAAGTTQPIARLGIPASILTDGPAGVRINPKRDGDPNTYYCTGFPVGTALACTWNQELVELVGQAIGNEVLEYGCDVLLAPGMNIHRSPLCGRNFEYYSEDPFLTGKIAAAYVRGIQSQGVGTSIKHYAGNSQETSRTEVDEIISQRALREIYLKGFEIAVREAKPWTVMSSYNRLNGPFTQESRDLLTTILRDEWGFDGIVMTDWTGQRNTAAQIHAGNDLMEPGQPAQTQEVIDKVKSGELKMEDLDICVKRILEYLVKTPRYRNYAYTNKPDLKAHAAVTRESATEGMVLLKNNDATLPLKGSEKASVFGITSYDFIAGGTGSGDVNKAYTIDLMTGLDVGYRYFCTSGKDVSYPFGYGLSYTTFEYSKPIVKATADGFVASIDVKNTGSVAGKEAVELYVSAPDGGLVKPACELKAFAKTRQLNPGESQTLTMNVSAYDLASYNEATQAWETAAGTYTVRFGANVEDVRATANYKQAKAQSVQCHDVRRPNMPLE